LTEIAVAHPEVHRQTPRHSPVVLRIRFNQVFIDVRRWRDVRLREASVRVPDQEVRELRIERAGHAYTRSNRRRLRRGGGGKAKREATLVIRFDRGFQFLVVVVSETELQRVLSLDLGD